MVELSLSEKAVNTKPKSRTVTLYHIANCGFTGRNEDEVQKHIEELEEENISTPDEVPVIYPKPSHLITTEKSIDVVSKTTSGEVEFVLLSDGEETYIGIGSDHTDRELEQDDIVLSKSVCPNIISQSIWRLSDVADHWDQLELRSWTGHDRKVYQETTLDAILSPTSLTNLIREQTSVRPEDTAIFSGSVGTETDELVYSNVFAAELRDPVLDRALKLEYTINELDWA